MAEDRQSHWRIRAVFAVAIVGLVGLSSAGLGSDAYAWNTQATGHYVAKVGVWATPSPTPTPTTCPVALFSYNQFGAEPYPMLVVKVWANGALPAGCSLSFSLNSYTTQGPDWPTTGTQALFDHESIALDPGHTSGTLTVKQPICFGQTDFYTGTTRFDGVDGPLPHYPDAVVPQPLLAWSNGGSACSAPKIISAPTPTPTTDPTRTPTTAPTPDPTRTPTTAPTPDPTPTTEG
jgi:hypothetical protein